MIFGFARRFCETTTFNTANSFICFSHKRFPKVGKVVYPVLLFVGLLGDPSLVLVLGRLVLGCALVGWHRGWHHVDKHHLLLPFFPHPLPGGEALPDLLDPDGRNLGVQSGHSSSRSFVLFLFLLSGVRKNLVCQKSIEILSVLYKRYGK